MQVSVKRENGMLKIDIDGRLYEPLSFKSFRPNSRNISEFYQAGVRLFSVLSSGIICALGVPYSRFGESWIGDHLYDFSAIDRQMDMFIENAPDAYFAPMFQLDTRPWYLDTHPDDIRALDMFKEASRQLKVCREAFENCCYPLFATSSGKDGEWDWLIGCWPSERLV